MDLAVINLLRTVLRILYAVTITITAWYGWSFFTGNKFLLPELTIANYMGITSVLLFCITLLPGMALRFGIKLRVIERIRPIRGNFGILMYLTAFSHYLMQRGFAALKIGVVYTPPLFEQLGISALIILLPVFMTANKFSLKRLRGWWKIIQQLVYIAVWFIAGHIVFGAGALWIKIIIATFAVLEFCSLMYAAVKKGRATAQAGSSQ